MKLAACILALVVGTAGCASTRPAVDATLDIAGGLALGALQGAGNGALTGLRIAAEARCTGRDCLAVVPVATGIGALFGGVTGAASGVQAALARQADLRNDLRRAGGGIERDVDRDRTDGRL